jgi:FkbM family methyltransferase
MLLFKFIFKTFYQMLRNKNGRTWAWLLWKYGNKKRYQPCKIKFLDYQFELPDALSFLYQFREIFVEEYYDFPTQNRQPLIYDCGTNVGLSIVYFKKKYPQAFIKAFEADENIATYLQKNLQKNQLDAQVEIHTKAVWIHDKGIELSSEGADAASIFGTENKKSVNSIRLNDFLKKETKIDMLKMDIEGAETEVLKDCEHTLNKIHYLFIEYHDYVQNPQSLAEILQILQKNNFRYFIKNEQNRKKNFIFPHIPNAMDLQINIFAINQSMK